jgi:hypothetical protein
LRACGLGTSSEIGGHFQAAYDYADKTGGADFNAKFVEGLETQIGALTKNDSFNKNLSSEAKVDLIKSTQACVSKFIQTYRPKTRSELISHCMDDLHSRVTGKGSRRQVITVKNWMVLEDHPIHEDENPIVNVILDYHSSYNRISAVVVQCKSNKYEYKGLEYIDSESNG